MRKTIHTKLLLLSTVLLSACASVMYTPLEVLRPAKIAFAPNANNLLVINNTVTQPANIGHVTEMLTDRPKNVNVETDSVAQYSIASLIANMQPKGFFQEIMVVPQSLNRSGNFAQIINLPIDSINKYADIFDADVVLSLDRIRVNDKLSEIFSGETNMFYGVLEAQYETNWSLHYPNNNKYISMTFRDTLYWESESSLRRNAFNKIPYRPDALIDGGIFVGKNMVNRLLPYWETVDKYFFTHSRNKTMQQAMDSVAHKKWMSAIKLWEKQAESKPTSNLAIMAYHNISTAYEIIENFDLSLQFANKAMDKINSVMFLNYNDLLKVVQQQSHVLQRKKEIDMLKLQMGEK